MPCHAGPHRVATGLVRRQSQKALKESLGKEKKITMVFKVRNG